MTQYPGNPAEFQSPLAISPDVHYPDRYPDVVALLADSELFPGGRVDHRDFGVPTPPPVLAPPPPPQGSASGLPIRRAMAGVDQQGRLRADALDPAHTEHEALRNKDLAQRVLVALCDTDNTGVLSQLAAGAVPEEVAASPQLANWMVDQAVRLVDMRGYMPRHEATRIERPYVTTEGGYAFAYNRTADGRSEPLMTSSYTFPSAGYEGRHRQGGPVNQAIGRAAVEVSAAT